MRLQVLSFCVSAVVVVSMLNGCTPATSSGSITPEVDIAAPGAIEVVVSFEKPGVLAKKAELTLTRLIITLSKGTELVKSDTLAITNSTASETRSYENLESNRTYLIRSFTMDVVDSVIHAPDSVSVEVKPNQTVRKKLNLTPVFSMLKMTYAGLPDSLKRLTTIIDERIVRDSAAAGYFAAGSDVPLNYDYVGVGIRSFRFEARGTIYGIDTLRYAGDTTLTIEAGDKQSIAFELKNQCKTPYKGSLNVEITLMPIGIVTITGTFEK